jgi:hypothetical protein
MVRARQLTGDQRLIRLLQVPSTLYLKMRRHIDDLVHELQIVQVGEMQGVEVAPEVAATIDGVLANYAVPRDEIFDQVVAAAKRGQPLVDIEVVLPPAAAEAGARLLRLLEQVDAVAAAGLLLTLPAADEIRHLRRWAVTEMTRQINGEPPMAYDPNAPLPDIPVT